MWLRHLRAAPRVARGGSVAAASDIVSTAFSGAKSNAAASPRSENALRCEIISDVIFRPLARSPQV